MTLIAELRAAGKLLGKLFVLDDGRRVVELVCRGRGCSGLCYFDAKTGEPVALDRPRSAGSRWRCPTPSGIVLADDLELTY